MANDYWSQEHYIKAYRFAAEAHQGQFVPDTEIAYIMHLSLVSMEVIAAVRSESGHDENLALQCALLHDVIEDTPVTYEQVEVTFGSIVAAGVSALTKNKSLDKSVQMSDSLKRIQQQPHEVWMVKLADRITNLQPPPTYWTKDKVAKYQAEATEILNALGEASALLSTRLSGKIEAYNAYL